MRSRDSQSRRRRLIHRGLLGNGLKETDDLCWGEEAGAAPETAGNEIEQAARAVLSSTPRWAEGAVEPLESKGLNVPRSQDRRDAGLAAIRSLLRGKSPVTWVFTGDNVVQGAGCTDGRRNCVEIFTERVRGELRRSADVILNTGVRSATAARLLAKLKRRALLYRPDVVAISLGINDCKVGPAGRGEFRRTIREILDRIRTAGGIPLVILPHPVITSASPNRADLPMYVEIWRAEIVRDEVPCVDHWADWLANWPDSASMRSRLVDGRIQLNWAAHQHLAGLIFQTLQIFDPASQACGNTGAP